MMRRRNNNSRRRKKAAILRSLGKAVDGTELPEVHLGSFNDCFSNRMQLQRKNSVQGRVDESLERHHLEMKELRVRHAIEVRIFEADTLFIFASFLLSSSRLKSKGRYTYVLTSKTWVPASGVRSGCMVGSGFVG